MRDNTVAISQRDAAKNERRERIVDAAAALVREVGFDSVNMPQIAERAGVAPATLYNLFKTKSAIFQRVFDLDFQDFQKRVGSLQATGALDRLFAALELASVRYDNEPDFYRALARAGSNSIGVGSQPLEARRRFCTDLVATAIDAGELNSDSDAHFLGGTLTQLMRGAFLDWVDGAISADRMREEVSYGFAMVLLTCASERNRQELRERLDRHRKALRHAKAS